MADFNVRSDAVDVEQIMRQIRARIRDKRGVDYTEEQIQELARVKLEKFLDPSGVRSDLLEQFRQLPSDVPPTYGFDDKTLFSSDKGIVRFFRRLLNPVLKLMINPNPLNQVLHQQVAINDYLIRRTARDVLVYEVLHNLVVEVTRSSIEVKNMKMRVESIASRLEFNERRARALEAVGQDRPEGDRRPGEPREPRPPQAGGGPVDPITGGDSLRSRRKRRRRGRRSGPGFEGGVAPQGAQGAEPAGEDTAHGQADSSDQGPDSRPEASDTPAES